jgi:hypothetical protein
MRRSSWSSRLVVAASCRSAASGDRKDAMPLRPPAIANDRAARHARQSVHDGRVEIDGQALLRVVSSSPHSSMPSPGSSET